MLDPEDLIAIPRLASIAASPDGTWLAAAVGRLDEEGAKYVHDLWCVPTDGGEATVLTPGPWNDRAPAFAHDGRLLFLSDRPMGRSAKDGETERSQVWALPNRGEATRVTDEPLGVSEFLAAKAADVLVVRTPVWPGVPHDAQREHHEDRKKHGPSALQYDATPVRHWDHWRATQTLHLVVHRGGVREDLTPEAGHEYEAVEWDLSRDGRTLVIGANSSGAERNRSVDLHVFDLESGERRVFGESGVWHTALVLDDAGAKVAMKRIAITAERAPEPSLAIVDVVTGEIERRDVWDRAPAPAAWDGDALIVTGDDEGRTPVVRVEASGSLEAMAKGSFAQVQPAGERWVAIRSGLGEAPRPVVVGGEALADPSGFGGAEIEVEELWVESTDGEKVQCMLLTPPGEGPHPTLFWIHGGPISQFGDVWHWRWNALVMLKAGYAVALPNARGSTGRGDAFMKAIWGDWGGQCYADLMAVADALEARPDIDGDRMIAMGGSFGGYMSNWIGGNTERFAAIVTHASLYDLRAFYGTTDHGPFFGKMLEAPPWSGDLDRHSPHAKVGAWKTPTLIIHGEKDYRVPIGEALALFEALQAHGVPSELLVFPDENHWILKPRNIVEWYARVLAFLERTLP